MDNSRHGPKTNDELQARVIEQCKVLKKENHELQDRLNKLKVSSTTEINIEKEHHKKTLLELTKVSRELKEIKSKNRNLEAIIQTREHEINDLKARIEMKGSMEVRNNEKEIALFQKIVGRNPMETSAQDSKIQSVIGIYELQKERQEQEHKRLHKELEEFKERVRKNEQERSILRKEFSQTHEEISKEFIHKFQTFEVENDRLVKENTSFRNNLDKLNIENNSLKQENQEIRRKYDDLRSRDVSNGLPPLSARSTNLRQSADFKQNKENANDDKLFEGFNQTNASPCFQTSQENFHSFKPYGDITDLTLFECRKIISKVLELFNLSNPVQILPSLYKMEKVLQAIPRLQGLLLEVSEMLMPRVDEFRQPDQIELIIPSLRKMLADLDSIRSFKELKINLLGLLELKEDASNAEIITKVEDTIIANRQFEHMKENEKQQGNAINDEDAMLVEQLSKLLGVRPSVNLFKQLIRQLDDIKHFIALVKNKMNLDPSMSNEACLTHLLKHVESSKKDDVSTEIVNKLRRFFNCNTEAIITHVEDLASQRYDKRITSSITKESFRK